MVAGVWQLRLDLDHLGFVRPDHAEDARARDWWASSSWGVVSPSWVSTAFPTCLESAASRTGQGAPLGPGTSHRSPLIYSSGLLFFRQWGFPGQRPLPDLWDALLDFHFLVTKLFAHRRSRGSTCLGSSLGTLPAEPTGLPLEPQHCLLAHLLTRLAGYPGERGPSPIHP